jgi:hypothetical protein
MQQASVLELSPADQLRTWAMSTRRVQPLLANLGLKVPTTAIGVAETMADELDAAYQRPFTR